MCCTLKKLSLTLRSQWFGASSAALRDIFLRKRVFLAFILLVNLDNSARGQGGKQCNAILWFDSTSVPRAHHSFTKGVSCFHLILTSGSPEPTSRIKMKQTHAFFVLRINNTN